MKRVLALGFLLFASPVHADSGYSQAFTDAFAAACVPERLSYDGTRRTAEAEGWSAVPVTDHPELDALLQQSVKIAADPEFPLDFKYQPYRRDIAGAPHYLVVSRADAGEIEGVEGRLIEIGCYLYNFDATVAPDPAPVTALIGKPVAHSQSDATLTAYLWGPPCPMPRTGDTYLTFIPEGSTFQVQTGFSGTVLRFSTSEPEQGEEVPATYC